MVFVSAFDLIGNFILVRDGHTGPVHPSGLDRSDSVDWDFISDCITLHGCTIGIGLK